MSRTSTAGQILSGHQVRVAAQPLMITDKPVDGSPTVQVRRDGGRITEIHVRCPCGELIVMDCEYDPPATTHTHRNGVRN